MKKIVTIIVILLIAFLSYYIYLNHDDILENTPIGNIIDNVQTKTDEDKLNKKVEETLENMSLDEKIAQMMIIDIQKANLTDEDYTLLKDLKPGGFILFGPNITTYETTLNEIKKIKETAEIPMFISIDEEGGKVARLDNVSDINVTKIPSMYEIGKNADTSLAYEVGKITGQKLRVFGINMDFAPCADVYSNPHNTVIGYRSFGSSPNIVSNMTTSFAKGLSETGIIPVYKHFPGHGDTATDSHISLPVIEKDKDALKNLDLVPFQNATNSGAEVIMVGHLAIPNITGDTTPASLSDKLINDLLKKEMGYQNLVITDSLKMGALTNYYTEEQIYENAINAGVDILLMPKDPENTLKIIKEKINLGILSEEQIDASVRKILKLKYKMVEGNYDSYLPSSFLNDPIYESTLNKIK